MSMGSEEFSPFFNASFVSLRFFVLVFLAFLCFSPPFFIFSLVSYSPRGQGQTTANYCKNGEFHSDAACTDPVQNFLKQGVWSNESYSGVRKTRLFPKWETDFYTPPVLRGAALFDNSAPAVYKILFPKNPEFYTALALNRQKGQHLSARELYKHQSPTEGWFWQMFPPCVSSRAMRGNTVATVPFQLCLGCTNFLNVLS